MTFKKIPFGTADKFNVVIEVPTGSKKKYEYDPEIDAIRLEKIYYGEAAFPLNYGHVAKTTSGDDALLDAFVLSTHPLVVGTVVECRAVGMVKVTDRTKKDNKILAVPIMEHHLDGIQDLFDVPQEILEQIKNFYATLKAEGHPDLEFEGLFDKSTAIKELLWAQDSEN